MKKRILGIALAMTMILGMFALTGCGSSDSSVDKDPDVLVVGLDDTFAPMGFRDSEGNLVGFDIDLATEVANEMGVEIEFKPIDWDSKDMELESGNIDCVWNGLSVTPERQENMALSKKYLDNKIVLMTLDSSSVEVDSAKDLKDLKIGTQKDSSALEMLKSNEEYDSFSANISEYDDYDAAIMDLKAGRVDVIAVDQVLGSYKNNNLDGELRECKYSLGDDAYAIGFYKENTELRDDVNDALEKVIDSGKATEISEKWFGKDIVIFEDSDE